MRFPRGWAACLFFLSWVASSKAHDAGLSTVEGQIGAGALVLTHAFAPTDANLLLLSSARVSGEWTPEKVTSIKTSLQMAARSLWEVRVGSETIAPEAVNVELVPGDNVSFRLEFRLPGEPRAVVLRSLRLLDLPEAHRQFTIIINEAGAITAQKLLTASDAAIEIALSRADAAPTGPQGRPTFWGFLHLGIRHIWTGYDHLLFLLGLLVVCRTFRSSIAIISCFTLAHSLTLALATLDVVHCPPGLIEPAIAASIIFVGLENLFRRGNESRARWVPTFGFGLLHGFGFATVLRDLGVGANGRGLALPLFSFNLGVEIGQVMIAAVLLPSLWALRKKPPFVRRGIPFISVAVAVAGFYWLIERTLLV